MFAQDFACSEVQLTFLNRFKFWINANFDRLASAATLKFLEWQLKFKVNSWYSSDYSNTFSLRGSDKSLLITVCYTLSISHTQGWDDNQYLLSTKHHRCKRWIHSDAAAARSYDGTAVKLDVVYTERWTCVFELNTASIAFKTCNDEKDALKNDDNDHPMKDGRER